MAFRYISKIKLFSLVCRLVVMMRPMRGYFLVYLLCLGTAQTVQAQGNASCNENRSDACKPIQVDGSSEPSRLLMATKGDVSINHSELEPPIDPGEHHQSSPIPLIEATPAAENAYPWTVGLVDPRYGPGNGFFWGGSILNKRWVVTAAHCVKDRECVRGTVRGGKCPDPNITIHAGSNELWQPTQSPQVVEVIVHEGYKPQNSWDNDIALLKLDRDLDLSSITTRAIGLLPASEEKKYASPKTLATIMGWGSTKADSAKHFSGKLMEIHVPIRTDQECRDNSRDPVTGRIRVTDNMFCAGYDKSRKGTCTGDSGGPLVVATSFDKPEMKYVLTGIVSWHVGCAITDKYDVYTRVSRYETWIKKHIQSGQ